jgi:hypothetical protein
VLLVVWVVVAVLAVLVLGGIGFGVVGAARRLTREAHALETEVRPVLVEVQQALDRAATRGDDQQVTSR